MADESILGSAVVAIRASLDQLGKDLEGAKKQVQGTLKKIEDTPFVKLGAKVNESLGTIAKVGLGGVTVAAAGALAGMGKLATDALPLQGVADAFAGITENASEALGVLREGSLGMVRDTDLMQSYNQAAQLVSKSFADQLPDAMQYLSKVSAATGEDMGFLLDSLVKGVGRLSPMILDNLAIQVSTSEATERAAKMFGVEASALTKTQSQAGMMSVVLEKLQANTAITIILAI